MDRRTKVILLLIGSLALFVAVGWFIVWPTLKPLVPARAPQPPVLPNVGTPPIPPIGNIGNGAPAGGVADTPGGVAVPFIPVASPDAEIIAGLVRRAGILAERVESGASSDGFTNLSDAQLDVSPSLATIFRTQQTALRAQYPVTGALYVTTARRLSAQGEQGAITGPTFRVRVQLQVTTRDTAKPEAARETVAYRQATVTFTNNGSTWIASGYTAEAFTP